MCVIAPSFAEIFWNNTFQNGILSIVLPEEQCRVLAEEAEEGLEFEVDLQKQEVRRASGKDAIPFTVDPFRRHCLLNGLDDIALTLQRVSLIEEFEAKRSQTWSWLDGLGYKGKKIPATTPKTTNKMDW